MPFKVSQEKENESSLPSWIREKEREEVDDNRKVEGDNEESESNERPSWSYPEDDKELKKSRIVSLAGLILDWTKCVDFDDFKKKVVEIHNEVKSRIHQKFGLPHIPLSAKEEKEIASKWAPVIYNLSRKISSGPSPAIDIAVAVVGSGQAFFINIIQIMREARKLEDNTIEAKEQGDNA